MIDFVFGSNRGNLQATTGNVETVRSAGEWAILGEEGGGAGKLSLIDLRECWQVTELVGLLRHFDVRGNEELEEEGRGQGLPVGGHAAWHTLGECEILRQGIVGGLKHRLIPCSTRQGRLQVFRSRSGWSHSSEGGVAFFDGPSVLRRLQLHPEAAVDDRDVIISTAGLLVGLHHLELGLRWWDLDLQNHFLRFHVDGAVLQEKLFDRYFSGGSTL
mmetsp:Transcript_75814/g.158038  ORF Transcript_75814/g.158038 Transcript_75814/m.158038 type:complete len:216 (-) Transcript_75814:1460-2107(-)